MRITVYTDGLPLMDTNLDNLKIINPKVTQEVNKVGKFDFTIYPDHPHFSLLQKMKSIITVYEEGQTEPLFRGRVNDEKQGFYNEKQVSCEGELAFLLDSVQRPWEFSGTPAELFAFFINRHNAQVDEARQFTVGNVTVVDSNDYIVRSNSDYSNTWKQIEEKLIKGLGGYLWVRHEGGINYIDYLADFNVLSNQPIEFGKNLLDLSKNVKVDGFATALIPLGAKLKDEAGNDTSERLTIEDVNNGVDFVYNADAVAEFGYIFTTNTWDDVTDATNLKRKAQAYIDDTAQFVASIDVSAADLNGATIDGEPVNVNSFRIGRYVKLTTQPHSLVDANFMISKLTRQLLKPEATKLTLGTTYKTLTQKQAEFSVIKGDTGATGKDGKGVASITAEYYLSTSKTEQAGGSWKTTAPEWEYGKYMWQRSKVTYTDGTTAYTTPVCDSSWEAVLELQVGGRNLIIGSKDLSANNVMFATYLFTDESSNLLTDESGNILTD